MSIRRFKTDVGVWLYLSLALFIALWFFPWIWMKGESVRPAMFWIPFFTGLFSPDVPLSQVGEVLLALCWFSLWFGISALAVGWVLQCFIVIFRQRWRDRHDYAASYEGSSGKP